MSLSLLEIRQSAITPSTALHAFATACALRHTPSISIFLSISLSLSIFPCFRLRTIFTAQSSSIPRYTVRLLPVFCTVYTGKGGIARSVHVQLGASTRHKMRHSLSLPTVTCICMRALPHCYNGPTTSFLHSQPIQTPPSGPGLIGAAGQVFICDDPSVTPLS